MMPAQALGTVGDRALRLSPNAGAAADAVDHSFEDVVIDINNLSLWYGKAKAIEGVTMRIPRKQVTALIGPSG
ncbi:MAG: hypothetical protein DWI58_21075, partial [Chloroflexi bacterium]